MIPTNNKHTVLYFLLFISILSCGKKKAENNIEHQNVSKTQTPSLELIWETDSILSTCESVLFDKLSKTIYVTNINNGPWEKDNNGFISTMDETGTVTNHKWLETGLSAPKGMGLYGNKLYVTDIDDLVEIDIEKQQILKKYTIAGNPQLNDVTVSTDGVVYFSGSNSNTVYKLEGELIGTVAKDSAVRLNGLLHQKEGVYFANSGAHNFGVLDEDTGVFKTLTHGVGHGDGIVRIENGDFIVSSWQGEVFYINSKDWSKTLLLDTREQNINSADIEYIESTQTLLVPTFFHNRVMAYKLNFK